jgi:DNA-binding protein H-NS
VAVENLSVDEIERQLAQLTQQRRELENALEQRRHQGKYELAEQIKMMIAERGYAPADITSLLGGRKRRGGAAAKAGVGRQYTAYRDPDDPSHVYVRGVLPGWMKAKMQEHGYDPSSKTDREAFKANVLQAVA